MKHTLRALPVALIVLAMAAGLGACAKTGSVVQKESYETATLKRSTIESVVTSSGTLSPVSEVSVLAQMSGRVEKVNADYNDHVKRGQILVELNTDMLKLQKQEAEADVNKAQAAYDLQALDAQNKETLAKKGLVSDYDLASSRASLGNDAAALASARAALKVIQTEIDQYALITSPIDGIVLDRNVDVGQSVLEGSSSNASSLFTLAEDLSHMEIKAEVDELDIGSIKVGQSVRFTVEAITGKTFTGAVHQIRLVPETTDNVVKYYVMINADNKDGLLLPGMTADVEFIVAQKKNVLSVPSAALRFQPPSMTADQIQEAVFKAGLEGMSSDERAAAETARAQSEKDAAAKQAASASGRTGLAGVMMPGPGGPRPGSSHSSQNAAASTAAAGAGADAVAKKSLWYLDDSGKLAVALVQAGVTDGTNTELIGADSLEGRRVIVKIKVN